MKNGRYEIVPDEAELVRRIYREYLSGDGYLTIAKRLNEDGIPSRFGVKWNQSVISKILSNYTYTGNLILQKTFRENHITKKTVINNGELPKYHAEDSHDAIISMERFQAVQAEKAKRAARFHKKPTPKKSYPFSGLLVCDNCGKNYRRKTTKTWSKTTVTSILQNEKYKGDALLQKKFTIDFLEKKMKPNEGEVPQYYVENSHPAIIEPDEWDHVQAELTRRKSLGRAYSGKSVFSAKLVCEECGSFFGSKVWHSTNQYRRRIWQCNGKFSSEERCHTPTLDTETIQRLFTQAYNQLMSDRKQTIADCELARKCLTDFAALDAEIERQLEETQVIAEMVEAVVKENASTAQSQEAYLKKYEALTERYEKAAAELERLQAERTARIQQDKKIALFIRTFKKLPETMTGWDDTIWTVMVEKAIVHRDGGITFIFKNGTEIKVGA